MPCLRILRAPWKSFAPIRWAAGTEKPAAAAEQNPPNIHVHVDIRPTDAAALTPRLPTIAESMNCISTDESCAIIAGKLIMPASLACCPKVIACPPRSIPRRVSLFILSISTGKVTTSFGNQLFFECYLAGIWRNFPGFYQCAEHSGDFLRIAGFRTGKMSDYLTESVLPVQLVIDI